MVVMWIAGKLPDGRTTATARQSGQSGVLTKLATSIQLVSNREENLPTLQFFAKLVWRGLKPRPFKAMTGRGGLTT
jgi:hypothetical protein